jgi:hypothetical protein
LPSGFFDDALLDKKMECPDQQVAEKVFPFSLREKVRMRGY